MRPFFGRAVPLVLALAIVACSQVTTIDDASVTLPTTSDVDPLQTASSTTDNTSAASSTTNSPDTRDESTTTATTVPTTESAPEPSLTAPEWLGSRPLPTDADGRAAPQPTPDELIDRRLPTIDTLPPPPDDTFRFEIGPFEGEPLARSTWQPECPVDPADLRYVTVSFWGFDEQTHTGELVIAAEQAEAVVTVFEKLHAARFPMEEMRIITPEDLDAPPTGDSNNTGSYACRAVVGGSRFSEHAFGLAIDINPFHNPYERGGVVLPELATAYLDREQTLDGMIFGGDVVVQAFADIGWSWGGNWTSLNDYHHFSLNNR